MKTLKIKSIKEVGIGDVYDITVNKYENYVLENGVITHNSGLQYASSTIIYLSKSKEKDGSEVVGNIIRAKTVKSRLSKENQEVSVRLFYDERGLDRYYGLVQLAESCGVFQKSGTRYVVDGKSYYEKNILEDPEKFFTPEIMKQIDNAAKQEFSYGGPN